MGSLLNLLVELISNLINRLLIDYKNIRFHISTLDRKTTTWTPGPLTLEGGEHGCHQDKQHQVGEDGEEHGQGYW